MVHVRLVEELVVVLLERLQMLAAEKLHVVLGVSVPWRVKQMKELDLVHQDR